MRLINRKIKKKLLTITLVLCIASSLIVGCGSFGDRPRNQKNTTEAKCKNDDFKNFVSAIMPVEKLFREHYEISREYERTAIEVLRNKNTLDSGFKIEALQNIKKTQRYLEELKNTAIRFKNSKNSNVREIAKECLILHEYASELMEQHYNFMSSPQEYISSNEGVNKLEKYTPLFKEQYEHLGDLIQKVSDLESSDNKQTTVEFKYSKEELMAMEKWKKKTTTEMISDAMNGDAAGLYMLGMCHLYGLGGFPMNIERANQYFAASALLGFAPAMDKIKCRYLEDKNPFLALVYVNLTASFGHTEYTIKYHDMRKIWVDKGEQAMITEVERIATKKQLKIYEMMNKVEKAEDKDEIIFSILFDEDGIIGEDAEFGVGYWEKFLEEALKTSKSP